MVGGRADARMAAGDLAADLLRVPGVSDLSAARPGVRPETALERERRAPGHALDAAAVCGRRGAADERDVPLRARAVLPVPAAGAKGMDHRDVLSTPS